MKINILKRSSLIACAVAIGLTVSTAAQTTNSTYVGPDQGYWNDPNNWSPTGVPNNSGGHTFNVTTADLAVILDIDAAVNSLKLAGDFPTLFAFDEDLTSGATSVAGNATDGLSGGALIFVAQHRSLLERLGNLADFSGTTLKTGYVYVLDTTRADPGVTATMQFNGANIVNSHSGIALDGPHTRFTDQYGYDALRNFAHNEWDAWFFIGDGHESFTTGGSLLNEGECHFENGSRVIVNGDFTNAGLTQLVTPAVSGGAASNLGDARLIVSGTLGNYNAGTKTLDGGDDFFMAAAGRSATTQTSAEYRSILLPAPASLV